MKVLFISTDGQENNYRLETNAYGGVSYYRLAAPQKAVNNLGYKWDFFNNEQFIGNKNDFDSFFSNYDAVVCKHIDNPRGMRRVKVACEVNKIPLIVDLDDDLFHIREDQPAFEKGYRAGEMKQVYLAANLSFANSFIVSTQPLKETYQRYFKDMFGIDMPIYVLGNYNDVELWNYTSTTHADKMVIGYHGSITHDSDLSMVIPHIDTVLSKYDNVYFELMGALRTESAKRLFENVQNKDRISIVPGTHAFNTFPKKLMDLKWDIGIAPLIDDEFNRGKSHIKYLEYAMKKIPTVASDVYPYTHNAKEAVLVKDNEWVDALSNLIENKKERKTKGKQAYDDVVKNHQYKNHAQSWVDTIQTVKNNYKPEQITL